MTSQVTHPPRSTVARKLLTLFGVVLLAIALQSFGTLLETAYADDANLAAGSIEHNDAPAISQKGSPAGLQPQYFNDKITEIPAAVTKLTLDTPQQVTLTDENDHVQWFSFTPTKAGAYIISSYDHENDPYGALYGIAGSGAGYEDGLLKLLMSNDDSDGGDFKIIYSNFEAGETYYIACSNYSDSDDEYTINIAEYDPASIASASASYYHRIWQGQTASLNALDINLYISSPYYDEDDDDWYEDSYHLILGQDFDFDGWYSQDEVLLPSAPSALGSYFVKLKGIGDYHGELYLDFRIANPRDLENGYWEMYATDVYYGTAVNANSLKLEISVDSDYGNFPAIAAPALNSGYKISAWYSRVYDEGAGKYIQTKLPSAPSQPGYYLVEVTGIGSFSGSLTTSFNVYDPKFINNYNLYYNDELWANGSPLTASRIGLVVYRFNDSRSILVAGRDYEITKWEEEVYDSTTDDYEYITLPSAPKDPGYYCATVSGKGSYTNTREIWIEILDPAYIGGYEKDYKNYVAYDGKPLTIQKLGLEVFRTDENGKKTTLRYGVDYTLTFEYEVPIYDEDGDWVDDEIVETNNLADIKDIGYYDVYLQGIGAYSGSSYLYFSIVDPKYLYAATISGVDSYYYLTGSSISINPTVTAVDGTKLTAGKHYTLSCAYYDSDLEEYVPVTSITRTGYYYVRAEAIRSSGYYDYAVTSFRVYPASYRENLSQSGFYISGVNAAYTYSGKAITPSVTVRSLYSYGNVLVKGKDYSVSYSANAAAGTAKVTVTGIGDYTGAITQTFKINKGNNPLTAKAKKKTVKVKLAKVKSKAQRVANIKVSGAKGKVTYKNVSKAKKAKKFKVNSAGKITVPKGTKKGTYTLKVKVTAKGNANYNSASKVVTFKVKVK